MLSQADRLKALKELCEKHYLDPNDQNTAAEDIAPYLDGEEEINEWAAVTRNNDITYVYPIFDNAEDAKDRATEHIIDDIYSEQPVEVVNLDTGERLSPAWYTMKWVGTKETKKLDRQPG